MISTVTSAFSYRAASSASPSTLNRKWGLIWDWSAFSSVLFSSSCSSRMRSMFLKFADTWVFILLNTWER